MIKKRKNREINDKWHYVIGHDEINFVFLDLVSYPLYGVEEETKDFLFELDMLINKEVFYPIHCMQIIAVLKYFLKKYDISAGIVLWIDGVVASGKTELACTVGDMFNRCGDNSSMKKICIQRR